MTTRPTDFDEHHELTRDELAHMPRLFRILAENAIRREGFYTYIAVRENAPELRVLVTIKE